MSSAMKGARCRRGRRVPCNVTLEKPGIRMRMATARAGLLLVLLSFAAGPARAAETVTVDAVPAATVLELADGRTLRLAGIRVPDAVAPAARAEIERLVRGREFRIAPVEVAHDRYGRLVAQVERADGLWLQDELLERGLAQVQTRPGETARAGAMRAIEDEARAARAGLWRDAAFRPRSPVTVHDHVGGFQIVAGRVHRVATTDDYVYLNFDEEWWTDFTIRFGGSELDAWSARSPVDVEALAGRRVEVRGFVVEAGGPLIDVSHPEQLEVLP